MGSYSSGIQIFIMNYMVHGSSPSENPSTIYMCIYIYIYIYICYIYIYLYISILTVVSRAAKQSRTSDTTVCYIHERSILIERSLKACYKKYLMKKRALQEQLPITSNIKLLLNKYSLFIFSNIPRNVGHFVVFFSFSSFSSFAYSLRMWA